MEKDISAKFKSFATKHNITRRVRGAETHWYYIEAKEAFNAGLFIASALCSFNAIESSIRTLLLYKNKGIPQTNLENDNLNHNLLNSAFKSGLNVSLLAFPGEHDFNDKIKQKSPKVEIVRLRNNLCHGNVFEFFETCQESDTTFFTPDHVKDLAQTLITISEEFTKEIDRFKASELNA